jgi:phospholipid-binding lipoprotein MlaA
MIALNLAAALSLAAAPAGAGPRLPPADGAGQTIDISVGQQPAPLVDLPPLPADATAVAAAPPGASPPGTIVVIGRRGHAPGDPLEAFNARSFAITQSVDAAAIRPLAMAYEHDLPSPIRTVLRHLMQNLHEPVVFLNFLLQLKPGKAAETLGRFAINSTLGIGGVLDVARHRPFDLPVRRNGFADTMGFYGVKPGAFLFLPIIGPTTTRDLVGGLLDRAVLPLAIGGPFSKPIYSVPVGVVSELDRRAQIDGTLGTIRQSEDPYAARRRLYLTLRKAEIDHLRGR